MLRGRAAALPHPGPAGRVRQRAPGERRAPLATGSLRLGYRVAALAEDAGERYCSGSRRSEP
jgi:hypothetical protein